MKKLLFTFPVSLLIVTEMHAQESDALPDKRFGFRLGTNYTNMIFSEQFPTAATSGKVSPKPGLFFGFLLHVPIIKKLTLQPEYLFSLRSAEVKSSQRNYTLTYLSMPLLLKYKIAERFYLVAGPQADLLVSSKRKTARESVNLEHKTEERNIDGVIGIEFKLIKSLHVDAHYVRGFSNIGIEGNSTEFKYEIAQLSLAVDF